VINGSQWLGVALILIAIVLLNVQFNFKWKSSQKECESVS